MSLMPSSNESDGDLVILTVFQAAEFLQVSENHLYSLVSQNMVPHVRFGKLIRIPLWGLLQYIASASGAPLSPGVAFPPETSVYVQKPDTEG